MSGDALKAEDYPNALTYQLQHDQNEKLRRCFVRPLGTQRRVSGAHAPSACSRL